MRSGDFSVRMTGDHLGIDGKLGGQAIVPGVAGTWKDLTDSVNAMCGNLTAQVRNIANVTTAVARGDLSRKITVDVRGEILELKDTINTMVDQLDWRSEGLICRLSVPLTPDITKRQISSRQSLAVNGNRLS